MLGNGKPLPPFSLETLELPELDLDNGEYVKQNSYKRYGRDRNEVEKEIFERYSKSFGS